MTFFLKVILLYKVIKTAQNFDITLEQNLLYRRELVN